MNYQKKIEFLSEIQEVLPVNNWRINGIRMWPFILHELNVELTKKITAQEETHRNNKLRLIIAELFAVLRYQYQAISDRRFNNPINKKADIVFLTQATRRVFLKSSYYDRICDPFFDAFGSLGYHCIALEWTYDHNYRIPRRNTSAFIQQTIDKFAAMSLVGIGVKSFYTPLKEFNALLSRLERIGIDSKTWLRTLERDTATLFRMQEYFSEKLQVISPMYGFVFPYFGIIGFAFVLACKELKIDVVDIQHGYYSRLSAIYSVYNRVPAEGYEMLPNYFWCWRESDRDRIIGWGEDIAEKHMPYLGGNLWNNIWLAPLLNDNNAVDYFDKKVKKIKSSNQADHYILITLSPFFNGPFWLPEVLQNAGQNYRWWIRFHHNTPLKTKNRIRSLFSRVTNIEFEFSSDLPLPSLFVNVDVHVTIESSCAVEAAEYGIPTVIVSAEGAAMFSDLIRTGWAEFADNQTHCLQCITKYIRESPENESRRRLRNTDIVESFIKNTQGRLLGRDTSA